MAQLEEASFKKRLLCCGLTEGRLSFAVVFGLCCESVFEDTVSHSKFAGKSHVVQP